MKLFSMILVSMFAISAAQAATLNPQDVMKRGAQLIQESQKRGKMDYLLNPIICADQSTGHIDLIYSVDFREKDTAYINISTGIVKMTTARLALKLVGRSKQIGDLGVFQLQVMDRVVLTCVNSLVVLE